MTNLPPAPDHRLVPIIRHRLQRIASEEVIGAVVALVNEDPLPLDECGFRFGDGPCVRVRGHERSRGDEVHVNVHGQTKRGVYAFRDISLF